MRLPSKLIKVEFEVDPSEWHGYSSERIWARKFLFRKEAVVASAPFFIRGVSNGDIIYIMDEGGYRFSSVVSKSGHATVRIRTLKEGKSSGAVRTWLDRLINTGCSCELAQFDEMNLWSVDVPRLVSESEVISILYGKTNADVWDAEVGDSAGRFDSLV